MIVGRLNPITLEVTTITTVHPPILATLKAEQDAARKAEQQASKPKRKRTKKTA